MFYGFDHAQRSSLTFEAAKKALEPHHDALLRCVRKAWSGWRTAAAILVIPHPTARATFMWNCWMDAVRAEFGDAAGVEIKDRSERFFLLIDKFVAVRLKKVDEELRTSNYPTKTALEVDGQHGVPGAPRTAPLVTIAYTVDPLNPAELSSIDVIYAIDKALIWEYSLIEPTKVVEQLPLPNPKKTAASKRVAPRREAAEERGIIRSIVKKKS